MYENGKIYMGLADGQRVELALNMCNRHGLIAGASGTGSLTLHKVDSGFIQRQQLLQSGVDVRCTVVSKLKDPDSWGAERVALYNVSFDDLVLADWQAAEVGSVTDRKSVV